MKKAFKCIISCVLIISLVFSSYVLAFSDEIDEDTDVHVHSRQLVSIPTKRVDDTDIAGLFYCTECDTYFYDTMTPSDIGMPIINFTGSFAGMSKENKVKVGFSYMSEGQTVNCKATLKWQGASSIKYPKKNYSMTLLKEDGSKYKICFVDSWGIQSKYCLKANYVDYSQSRNIVSAKIFGEIVKSRNKGDRLETLVNGGAIDGYPVVIYHDGVFQGLYTLNIPKDDWLFGMGNEKAYEAIFFGDDWSDSVALKEEIAEDVTESLWDIEYCSTEKNELIGTKWIRDNFNEFIRFLNTCTKEEFNEHINDYTDVDRAIDLFIYTIFLHANDNLSKNIIWATYDGTHWIPSAYDLDGTWGLRYDGELYYASYDLPFDGYNKLFSLLLKYKQAEIKARYVELREDILSISNIRSRFTDFFDLIPDIVYDAEREKWPDVNNQDRNNYDQIIYFATKRINYLDNYFGVRIIEKTDLAYKVSFARNDNINLEIYSGIDLTKNPVASLTGWTVNSKSGTYTKKNGSVYFRVTAKDGFELDNLICDSESYKLLGPEETGVEDVYAITGLNDNCHVDIFASEVVPDAYKIDFILPDGVTAYIYSSQDYTTEPEEADSAYSVDAETGLPVATGEGQVDFLLRFAEGVEFDSIDISPIEGYMSLTGPDETGNENTFRISKIMQHLTVTVYTSGEPAPEKEGYTVAFEHADNVKVFVYPGQNYTMSSTEAFMTYSVDPLSGEPTVSGEGQVNFRIELPEYTEITGIDISPSEGIRDIKDSSVTGVENVFRITKISSDISVSISTVTHVYDYNYETIEDDDGKLLHKALCECGLFITEPHSFGDCAIVDNCVYKSCEKCGYSVQLPFGDANNDDKITVVDARIALRFAIGLDEIPDDGIQFILCDIDGDGSVTVSDARLVLRAAIGLENDLQSYHNPKSPEEETTIPDAEETTTDESVSEQPTEIETPIKDSEPEDSTISSEEETTVSLL